MRVVCATIRFWILQIVERVRYMGLTRKACACVRIHLPRAGNLSHEVGFDLCGDGVGWGQGGGVSGRALESHVGLLLCMS